MASLLPHLVLSLLIDCYKDKAIKNNSDLPVFVFSFSLVPALGVAGVVRGGAPRTALVLVLAAVDAGREGVLAEVVAVRRRELRAVLLVGARRVLRRRRARRAPARAPLRRC